MGDKDEEIGLGEREQASDKDKDKEEREEEGRGSGDFLSAEGSATENEKTYDICTKRSSTVGF